MADPAQRVPEPERSITVGRLTVEEWHTGASHAPPLPAYKRYMRVTFDGREVTVHNQTLFDDVDVAPLDDPHWVAVAIYGDGWYVVDATTGDATRLWKDWFTGGVWSLDGRWFLSSSRGWDCVERRSFDLAIPAQSFVVAASPDGAATLEKRVASEWVDGSIVSRDEFLVRRVRDGVVLQTQSAADVATATEALRTSTGRNGFPWPATHNFDVLWIARHVDWTFTDGEWTATFVNDGREWPATATTTHVVTSNP